MMRIIPAIDIIDGKCVRLSKGDYDTVKIYNNNPIEIAKEFEAHGIQHLHLVDLDGAKNQHIVNYKILESIASETSLSIDFGGGIKSDDDLKIAFNSGARQITGGSITVKSPEIFERWIAQYSSEKIILGADTSDGYIAVQGWTQTSEKKLIPFVQEYHKKGIRYVICTDISKDGMLAGTSNTLYKEILAEIPNIALIASGGVSCYDDLIALHNIGCEGAIIGKAIYENHISLKQLEQFILQS